MITGRDEAHEVFLTTKQVSERYYIPEPTLRWWRSKNIGIPCFRRGGRVVYRLSECEAWHTEQEAATIRGGAIA